MYPVAITGHLVILRELTGSDPAGLHKAYGTTRHLNFEPQTMEQAAGIISAATRFATADPRTEYMPTVAGKDQELRCYGGPLVPPSLPANAARSALRWRSFAVKLTGAEVCPAQNSKGSPGVCLSRRSFTDFVNVS